MKKSLFIAVAAVLALYAVPDTAFGAESLRCGRYIISSGQRPSATQYEVLKKCGEPTMRNGLTWIYDDARSAPRAVTFDQSGRVMRIERLSK